MKIVLIWPLGLLIPLLEIKWENLLGGELRQLLLDLFNYSMVSNLLLLGFLTSSKS